MHNDGHKLLRAFGNVSLDDLTVSNDIDHVIGHSTPIMLKKYIKADQLEVVKKITDKYDYFN